MGTTHADGTTPDSLVDILRRVSSLTSAQQTLLRRIAAHDTAVTVAQLAAECGLHANSVRETLDALVELGLVNREQMPISGRGRPAIGYVSYTPADPAFPAQMLAQMTHAAFQWLRHNVDDPQAATASIGAYWADDALRMMRVPDHALAVAQPGFSLIDHMNKIRLFLNAFGFAVVPHPDIETALVLNSCPFTRDEDPDPLALAMRQGMLERVLELTACDTVTTQIITSPEKPLRCELILIQNSAYQEVS